MSSTDGGDGNVSPIVLYEHPPGRWSAATSVGLLFFNLSSAGAEARLAEAGIAAPLVSVDGLTWRSTFMSATASELEAINETLETQPTAADVAEVRTEQSRIRESLTALSATVAAEQRRREIEAGEAELRRRANELLVATVAEKYRDEPRNVALVWAVLRDTPLWRRIQELRQA